ncbi:dTDP-4-dehydrorhamnose reductase [Segatella bryantii]|uniref:dTDP-4-dehydrorhamnose reductase n=1 Tax=Segatella bryantii TaxID=77095 RepID=UPI00285313D7|nr:dTDP-4-dehydrorhamnose reductase [Segatella bryantii]MDR4931323.1 dTDP-4-dehydrorhamnose reductase [Segatella bryantii]
MNILVTGANGQLGNEMRIVSKNTNDNYIFTDVNEVEGLETTYLDITDIDAIRKMVKENNVNAIVNCAAWTNVDACENDEKLAALAEKLNADAPENLARVMKEVDGWLIQISTDYVFGKEPYNVPCGPDQKGTPTGVYGKTKLHGEQKIIATGCKHVIIRTAWLYSEFGKNFCKTMLNLTATKPALKVVFDQCGTPTYALDLANAIITILQKPQIGIFHFSNEGVCSWYDFTQMIAKIVGHTACDIQPCYSSEYPSPVTRPSYSVLDKRTIKETFGVKVPYWVDSLEKCIANLNNK